MDTKDLKGLMEAYSEMYAPQELNEAVKGADPEMRKAASAERRGGDKRLSPSTGKGYAAHAMQQAAYVDKKTKGKHIPGYAYAEEVEQLDEISQKTATSAYARRRTGEFEGDDASDRVAKTNKLKGRIEKKFGKEAGKHADRAADVQTFGRKDASGRRKQSPQPRIQTSDHENQREFKRELRIKRDRRLRAARGEDTNEQFDIFDVVLEFLQVEGYAETLEEAEWMMTNELDADDIEAILEAEGSYGETPKAYSAASKTKMTAKRKPFLKAMQRRTNPANRKDAYDSPRKGMTASDREEARAGAAHGSPRGHDYPSQGPGGVTKNPKKLRKQKAMGEFAKEDFDIFDVVLEFLQVEGYAETLEEAEWLMANVIDEEAIDIILGEAEKPFPYEKVKAKQVALRDKGSAGLDRRMKMGAAVRRAKEAEKTGGSQQDAGKGWYHAKEDYVNEAQSARENPEKYEREQAKKSAPVRGERTPMPPRGDKRREDFEKWYAKNVR